MVGSSSALQDPSFSSQPACPTVSALDAQPAASSTLYTPAAMVGYFDELSDAIQKGIVEPGELSDIATRHAMEVLGPVPEGYV